MTLILGLDPGAEFGYGLVQVKSDKVELVTSGFWKLSLVENKPMYHTIYSKVKDLIARYNPTFIAMETAFVGPAVRKDTAIKLGEKRGAALAAIEGNCSSPPLDLAPKYVKKIITDNGNADKSIVRKTVMDLFDFYTENENESDAIAVAVAGIKKILSEK